MLSDFTIDARLVTGVVENYFTGKKPNAGYDTMQVVSAVYRMAGSLLLTTGVAISVCSFLPIVNCTGSNRVLGLCFGVSTGIIGNNMLADEFEHGSNILGQEMWNRIRASGMYQGIRDKIAKLAINSGASFSQEPKFKSN